MNTSSTKKITLITGGIVIALAVLLFVNAMTVWDFAQPGQGLFQGRSNILLGISFVLLIGLAIALLFMIFLDGRVPAGAPVDRVVRKQGKAAATRSEMREEENLPLAEAGGNTERQVAVLSDTAGELRNAVDAIQEELEEILEDEAPADNEHVQSIFEETDRLKKIIDSMEQLNRVQEITRLNRKEPLQVEPLLQGVMEATRQAVPDKDVTYNLECEAGLAMEGDPECIYAIIGNIVDNAEHAIKGSGSVTLTANRRNGMVVFSVKDTGPGIRRAHLSHIYERFFRGSGTGIGMGLAIAKELVDACGGNIEVQTAADKGTTFIVQMPG